MLGYGAVAEAQDGDDDDDDRGANDMTDLMTTAEAARHLGVSPGYLTNLRCWGTGPRWRRGERGRVTYRPSDLDDWRAERQAALASR